MIAFSRILLAFPAWPETSEFSAHMAKLCDGPPKFYNLDVWQSS